MAMNFWEAQKRARSRTTLYVTIFILLTLFVAFISEMAMRSLAQPDYNPPLPYVGMAFLTITFCVAIFQYMMFRTQGGAYVAESMGGKRVNKNTATQREQMLLNIVEEISVAAGVPIPAVYVINSREINAFAAGMNKEDAAVAVTLGTLNLLNRDELQGVIAHEFGHIRNGDMLISMRMAAMVMGFFCVLYLAMRILQFSSYRVERRDDEDRRGGNPLMLAAMILTVAGAFTWLFGSILKSSISREREYLADASAVQFTRNPDGIANALRKIAKGASLPDDMPKSGMAFSHMYFEDKSLMSSLFATHPPIKKRIEAIEGRLYIPEEWEIEEKNK